jgi:hypothetical protein
MMTMVKKKTIKENVKQEESEYPRKVGSISKQEMNTPNITVPIQRKSLR